jgi:hypothetical protein
VQGIAAVMCDVTSRFEEIRSLKQKLAEAATRTNNWRRIKLSEL